MAANGMPAIARCHNQSAEYVSEFTLRHLRRMVGRAAQPGAGVWREACRKDG